MAHARRYDWSCLETDHARRQSHVQPHRIIQRAGHKVRHPRAGAPDGRGHDKRASRRGSRPARERRALRADRRPRGLPRRALHPQLHDDLGKYRGGDAGAQGRQVRHGSDRALQKARGLRREGDRRDVPGRREHAPRRGRQRDPLGRERLGGDGVKPEREGLRIDRRMAQPAVDLASTATYT